jgi:hypothetical protein
MSNVFNDFTANVQRSVQQEEFSPMNREGTTSTPEIVDTEPQRPADAKTSRRLRPTERRQRQVASITHGARVRSAAGLKRLEPRVLYAERQIKRELVHAFG